MLKLGIDIGSRNTKIVIFDDQQYEIMHSAWCSTEVNPRRSVETLIDGAIHKLNMSSSAFAATAVTGYGRKLFQDQYRIFSEISCHAAGCLHLNPRLRCIVDIGGQDSKVICLDEHTKIKEFIMNDKCAAGTGRFLEMTALRLGIEVSELSSLASRSKVELELNSTCVVFAESEIIGMMSSSISSADIAKAVHLSIARRIKLQMAGLDWAEPLGFTGGVAMNDDLAQCLGKVLDCQVWVPHEPEITAALGAAILA